MPASRTPIQSSRRVPAAEKAAYHQVSGAGRAHTLRRFFGLSPSDKAAIQDRVQRHLDKVLK